MDTIAVGVDGSACERAARGIKQRAERVAAEGKEEARV